MKNVTITLDEATLQWLRRVAAGRQSSVSSLVGELLREQMQLERRYELGMRQYLSLEPRALGSRGQKYGAREALHDRPGLR